MIVTHVEATRHECRVMFIQRGGASVVPAACSGPGCMHWRWFDMKLRKPAEQAERYAKERRGYCGMGGKPEHTE